MEKFNNFQQNLKMKIENPFWDETFLENLPKWIHIWLVSLSFISSIVFTFTYLTNYINKDLFIIKLLAISGMISTLLLLLNRDSFLPFLGESFIPEIFLDMKLRKPKNVERTIEIYTDANREVVYWAADPGKDIKKTWKKGYNKFENSGIVVSGKDGIAKIPIQCPSRYIVHGYKVLPKHLHYRIYNKNTQMLGRIQTITLDNQCK